MLRAGRRPGPAAATCRESPPLKSRPCPPPTTPLPVTVARRRRMIKDHYVPRRNQPGQRLLGAQRSQLPPAVHLARRPAAASPRPAGSEVHPARQRAAGWARCLRDPAAGRPGGGAERRRREFPGFGQRPRVTASVPPAAVPVAFASSTATGLASQRYVMRRARCPRGVLGSLLSVAAPVARQVISRGLGALGGGLTGRVTPPPRAIRTSRWYGDSPAPADPATTSR